MRGEWGARREGRSQWAASLPHLPPAEGAPSGPATATPGADSFGGRGSLSWLPPGGSVPEASPLFLGPVGGTEKQGAGGHGFAQKPVPATAQLRAHACAPLPAPTPLPSSKISP